MISENELKEMDEDANAFSNDCPRLVRILTNEVRRLQQEVSRLQGSWEAAEQRLAESADMVQVGQITAALAMERDEARDMARYYFWANAASPAWHKFSAKEMKEHPWLK